MVKSLKNSRKRLLQIPMRVAVAIPTPISHNVCFDPFSFLAMAVSRRLIEYEPFPTARPEFGRNMAIKKFLTYPGWQKYTHLLFLDADTWPDEEYAIERLLSHNKPFIAGITPILMLNQNGEYFGHWSAFALSENGEPKRIRAEDELPDKLFKASQVGGTTLLIHREVLEKLTPPYQQCIYNEDVTGWNKSEDFYFTDSIRRAGYDLWVDPEIKCHHIHSIDLLEMFKWVKRTRQIV